MNTLDGKTALVTGAGGGIGAAYAGRLAELGATVLVADINEGAAKTVAETIASPGHHAIGVAIDVTDETSIDNAVAIAREHGGLDILVNNAAVYKGMSITPVEHMEAADWRRMIDVNVTGVFLVSKAFIPQLRAKKGVIVNQSSSGAYMAAPQTTHYAVSKTALLSFTRCLAAEVGPDGIRVNGIAPGFTMTEATAGNFDAARAQASAQASALRRNGETDDILGVLEFLVTPMSGWMTGQTLVVDGGRVFPQ